jgi:hypothetical protein
LAAVIRLNARRRNVQRIQRRDAALRFCRVDLALGKTDRLRRQRYLVEFRCQVDQRRIAAIAHVGDDRAHGFGDVFFGFALGRDQRREARREFRCARVQPARHLRTLSGERVFRAPPIRR